MNWVAIHWKRRLPKCESRASEKKWSKEVGEAFEKELAKLAAP
jgi:hypothetical protein